MPARVALLAALCLLLAPACLGVRYITSGARDPEKLNVHVICHSHDDAGWLKTVDQYFYGAKNSIQVAGVQYILDTVTQSLHANPNRKFVFADMAFFMRWWPQQDDDTKELVSALVEEGRLDFANGGYVQHDEAASHYVAMIDQTTRGHMFLKHTFGHVPRVGWQLDPFGHSSTQAGLLSAQVGFDALFFGRADYQDMDYRKRIRALEMVWRGSGSLEDAEIFTGNFISGNYGPPGGYDAASGFDFDWGEITEPIMDDPRLSGYNVDERVDTFVERCMETFNATRGNDIMVTMGSDFHYANAHATYKNLDKLIHYLNKDGRLNAFYSTPAEYVKAKHGYNEEWPLKTDDFFPYADNWHAYWTGYFTSRPTSKGFIRSATSYLQAARQLEAFAGLNRTGWTTDALEEAISLTQHHDAITGTEKQHVANDYHMRLHRGMREAQQVALSALSRLVGGDNVGVRPAAQSAPVLTGPGEGAEQQQQQEEEAPPAVARRRLQADVATPIDAPVHLHACNWLNISACPITVTLTEAGKGMLVVAYNPLAWGREAPVRVPVSGDHSWEVKGPEGEAVAAQLVPVPPATRCLQSLMADVNATCPVSLGEAELVFLAQLPPSGYSSYLVQRADEPSAAAASAAATPPARVAGDGWPAHMHGVPAPAQKAKQAKQGCDDETVTLDNGVVSLEFECERGILRSIKSGGVEAALVTRFAWYNSSDGLESQENRGQASGAYIFRPNGVYDINPGGPPVSLEIVKGDVVSEARQAFNDWTTLVTRLYAGQPFVEFEWTVGPIPFDDGLGREVVVQYVSNLDSGDAFWTDANGREMIKRVRDVRPAYKVNVTEPAAGNYYPLTAAMYIQDKDRQLAVLTERGQGGSSLRSGELEVMLHRRTALDDWRGVGEPLNETVCGCTGADCDCPGLVVRGVHWLMLSPPDSAASQRRRLQQLLNDPPLLAFGPIPSRPEGAAPAEASSNGQVGLRRKFSMNPTGLPSNVHLLTFKELAESSRSARRFLVRLAHLFQEGEDRTQGLSQPVSVDLNLVMTAFEYSTVSELSLSGNQLKSDALQRLRFKAGKELKAEKEGEDTGSEEGGAAAEQGRTVGSHEGESVDASSPSAAKAAATKARELAALRARAQVVDCRGGCRSNAQLVTLHPMEVRTFEFIWG